MSAIYTWKKKLFDNQSTILQNENPVGQLNIGTWTPNGEGFFENQKLRFVLKGWTYQTVEIVDATNGMVLGVVKLNGIWTKAQIILNSGLIYSWKVTNWLNTKWILDGADGTQVIYDNDMGSKGSITNQQGSPLLVLTGLYIAHFIGRMTLLVMAILFIPLFLRIL